LGFNDAGACGFQIAFMPYTDKKCLAVKTGGGGRVGWYSSIEVHGGT